MGNGNQEPNDPLGNAGRAFEQHERELLETLMARAQRDIPPGATVAEAVAEMQRAVAEDDDAKELLMRVAVVQSQNGGYIRSHFERLGAEMVGPERAYTSANRGRPLTREELDLMKQLADEIDRRMPPEISEEEREAEVAKLLEEDERLGEMVAELDRSIIGTWLRPSSKDEDSA